MLTRMSAPSRRAFLISLSGAPLLLGCALRGVKAPLAASGIAPALALPSTDGPMDSRAALAQGPLVLVFYRGDW